MLFRSEKDAVLIYTTSASEGAKRYISTNQSPYDLSIAVLVNGGTASAAEAAAAALASRKRAHIVGSKSFGKATAEGTYTLSNEMRVRFIIRAMFAPQGLSWNERGIAPEVRVDASGAELTQWLGQPLERRVKNDKQLRIAWQMLRQ